MIEVLFTTLTPVAAVPPSFTVAPARKPVPVMVTAVPPFAVPLFGAIDSYGRRWIGCCVGIAIVQRPALRIRVRHHHTNRASLRVPAWSL